MADGWEQTKAKGWRSRNRQLKNGAVVNSAGAKNLQDARPSRVVDGLTVEKLVDDFKKMEKRWSESEYGTQIENILGRREGSWDVKEGVCIGIGSFSVDWEHRYRALWQLILFMAAVKYLSGGASIQLYAQEPAFTSLDEEFLKALDVTVLPGNAQAQISRSSLLFAPFVDWFLMLPVFLRGKDPVLYIGNEILDDYRQFASTEEREKALEECHVIGKLFIEGRPGVKLPEFPLHPHALNGLMAYWKEVASEE